MFATCKSLRAKVEEMEEFAHIAWSIQAKVEICWSGPYVWLELPQAQVNYKYTKYLLY